MTRKHYEKVAKELLAYRKETRGLFPDYAESKGHKLEALDEILDILSDIFKADNPNFDRDRFVTACGQYEVEG
jgi:hypothetical protein